MKNIQVIDGAVNCVYGALRGLRAAAGIGQQQTSNLDCSLHP